MNEFNADRRSIVRNAAWAIPAVSTAAAAPSLAASTGGGEPLYQTVTKTYTFRERDNGSDVVVTMTAENVPLSVPERARLRPLTVKLTTTVGDPSAFLVGSDLGDPAAMDVTFFVYLEHTGAFSRDLDARPESSPDIPVAEPLEFEVSGQTPTVTVPPGTASSTGRLEWRIAPAFLFYGYNEDGTRNGQNVSIFTSKIPGNDYEVATFSVTA